MCYKKKCFRFLSISIVGLSLVLAGCSKDEILDQYNNVVQSAGDMVLTSDFSLKGNRTYGDDCYTGTYTADYKDFSKTLESEKFSSSLESNSLYISKKYINFRKTIDIRQKMCGRSRY